MGALFAALLISQPAFAQDFDGWRLMPVRTQGQFDRGELGGRAEQYMQGAARCLANPDIVYLSHDCSQIWRSDDGGQTWAKPLAIGLYLSSGNSIEVDPVDCDRVTVVMDNAWDYWHSSYAGIYRSEDGGNHFSFVQPGPTLNSRRYEHDVAWAPSSVDSEGAARWYAALYNEAGEDGHDDSAIYVSDDYGETWTRGASLADHESIYEIEVSPSDSNLLYVATSSGLLRSGDGGDTLTPVADVPAGAALSVAFDPAEATTIYAVFGNGLYRAVAGGDFTKVTVGGSAQTVLDDAARIFMHPTDGDIFYVVPQSSDDAVRTEDGGASFQTVTIDIPDDVRAWRWGIYFRGTWPFFLMSAADDSVVAQATGAALYRSTDGYVFGNGSELFAGANCGTNNFNIAFDEVDQDRFATGNQDIGMYYTDNGANWFSARSVPWAWVSSGTVAWGNMSSLSFRPGVPGEVVSSVGDMFTKRLAHSEDNGVTWELVEPTANYNWRVVYNLTDNLVVYAGDRRSVDGGKTFSRFPFGSVDESDLQVMDLCRAEPDTLYAAARASGHIVRSDDQGDTWSLYATAPGSVSPFDPIPTFAVDPADCDVVYTLDSDGDIARYDGSSWTNLGVLSAAAVPEEYDTYVRAFLVDPRHPEVYYAALFGAGIPLIFRSVDSGGSWQDVSYNHFRSGASGFNISPVTGEVMVGGCSGTWVLPPPYETPNGIYDDLVPRPSCYDGLQNGDETGVDTGGACGGGADNPDAGPGGADAGSGTPDAGTGADSDTSGGCGCRADGSLAGGWFLAGLFLVGVALSRRRRR